MPTEWHELSLATGYYLVLSWMAEMGPFLSALAVSAGEAYEWLLWHPNWVGVREAKWRHSVSVTRSGLGVGA